MTAVSLQVQKYIFFALTSHSAITAVENKARLCREVARTTVFRDQHKVPFYDNEQNIEIITRSMVRKDFVDLLGGSLANSDLRALEKVLFDVIYPCLGRA